MMYLIGIFLEERQAVVRVQRLEMISETVNQEARQKALQRLDDRNEVQRGRLVVIGNKILVYEFKLRKSLGKKLLHTPLDRAVSGEW